MRGPQLTDCPSSTLWNFQARFAQAVHEVLGQFRVQPLFELLAAHRRKVRDHGQQFAQRFLRRFPLIKLAWPRAAVRTTGAQKIRASVRAAPCQWRCDRAHFLCCSKIPALRLTINLYKLSMLAVKVDDVSLLVYNTSLRVRARGEDIRHFILDHIENHSNDIAKVTTEHFGITRQAANKHLKRLVQEKSLSETGQTRRESTNWPLSWSGERPITFHLKPKNICSGNRIFRSSSVLGRNVADIWHYGFSEMLNNARDHSGSTGVVVGIKKTAVSTDMYISDNGVGIFKKLQEALRLTDERYAVLELAKGKLTTDPARHTGEAYSFPRECLTRSASHRVHILRCPIRK